MRVLFVGQLYVMGRTYERKRAFQDIAQSVGALQPYGLGRVVHRGFQEAALQVGGSVAARPRRVATRLQHRANSSGGYRKMGRKPIERIEKRLTECSSRSLRAKSIKRIGEGSNEDSLRWAP